VIADERAIDDPEGPQKDGIWAAFGRCPVARITVGVQPAVVFEMGSPEDFLEAEGEQKTIGEG
jgi:hypothetical protein